MPKRELPTDTRADYPHFLDIPTRWIDNDIYGHVNNALYYFFFDTVINKYLLEEGGLNPHAGPVIGLAVETQCQFLQPISFPDVVEAGLRVGHLGKSSVRYEVGIFRQGHEGLAAAGYFVHVFVDFETRRPVSMPDTLRGALENLVTS